MHLQIRKSLGTGVNSYHVIDWIAKKEFPVHSHNAMLYLSLCVIRFLCALLPGYIHPDEFFQGPEVLAGREGVYFVIVRKATVIY